MSKTIPLCNFAAGDIVAITVLAKNSLGTVSFPHVKIVRIVDDYIVLDTRHMGTIREKYAVSAIRRIEHVK